MSLALYRAEECNVDFERQYRWYLQKAGEDLAERFLDAVLITLRALAEQPDLGCRRKFRHAALHDLRSFRVAHPIEVRACHE